MGAVYIAGDIARRQCAAFQMKVMDEMRPTRQRVEGSVVARGGRWGRAIGLVVSDDFNAVVVMRVLWEDASPSPRRFMSKKAGPKPVDLDVA